MLRERLVGDLPVTVAVRGVQAAGRGVVLEADLEVDRIDPAEVGDKDMLELSITQGRPPLALSALGTKDGGAGRTLRFRSVPVAVDAAMRTTLEQLVGQTLTRARLVSASPQFAAQVQSVIRAVLCRPRNAEMVAGDVVEMRKAIASEKGDSDRWNLKYAAGGLIDIEFIAQYLQLIHAAEAPEILDAATARVLEKPLTGVVSVPAENGWQTLTMPLLADIKSFWPDILAEDSGLARIRYGIRVRNNATGQAAKLVSPIQAVTNGTSDSQNSRCRFAHKERPSTCLMACSR